MIGHMETPPERLDLDPIEVPADGAWSPAIESDGAGAGTTLPDLPDSAYPPGATALPTDRSTAMSDTDETTQTSDTDAENPEDTEANTGPQPAGTPDAGETQSAAADPSRQDADVVDGGSARGDEDQS